MTQTIENPIATGRPPAPSAAAAAELFCPECGYDLHGTGHSDRCPECGTAVDRSAAASESRIPWVHRATIGRVAAYRRTLWLTALRPRRLGAEAARPVSDADARRFSLMTALVAGLPPAGLLTGAIVWLGGTGFLGLAQYAPFAGRRIGTGLSPAYDLLIPWEAGVTLTPVTPVAVVLFMLMAGRVAEPWFRPAALPMVRRDRAAALSRYAAAPLVWLWTPLSTLVVCEIAACVLRTAGLDRDEMPLGPRFLNAVESASAVAAAAVLAVWWRGTLSLLRATTQAGAGRLVLAGVLIPAAWVACAGAALVVFPWVAGYARLIFGSLR